MATDSGFFFVLFCFLKRDLHAYHSKNPCERRHLQERSGTGPVYKQTPGGSQVEYQIAGSSSKVVFSPHRICFQTTFLGDRGGCLCKSPKNCGGWAGVMAVVVVGVVVGEGGFWCLFVYVIHSYACNLSIRRSFKCLGNYLQNRNRKDRKNGEEVPKKNQKTGKRQRCVLLAESYRIVDHRDKPMTERNDERERERRRSKVMLNIANHYLSE